MHQQTAIASPSTMHGARECHYFACPGWVCFYCAQVSLCASERPLLTPPFLSQAFASRNDCAVTSRHVAPPIMPLPRSQRQPAMPPHEEHAALGPQCAVLPAAPHCPAALDLHPSKKEIICSFLTFVEQNARIHEPPPGGRLAPGISAPRGTCRSGSPLCGVTSCATLPGRPRPPVEKGTSKLFFDAHRNSRKAKAKRGFAAGASNGARITAAALPTAIPDGTLQNVGELHRLDLSYNRIATVTVGTFATGPQTKRTCLELHHKSPRSTPPPSPCLAGRRGM